jgi:GMP reductase
MEIFDYDNILLLPRKCRVESRSECDASVELGGRSFRIPVVPANMKTVVDEKICVWLAKNGYFYVMHRFDLDNVAFVRDMKAQGVFSSISLGVKKPDYETVDKLRAEGLAPDYITIDIAHGHADSVKNMIGYLKQHLPSSFVIAGNVGTPEAVIDLENWGSKPALVQAAGSFRRSSGVLAWRPNPSSPTAASEAMAILPRASALARAW